MYLQTAGLRWRRQHDKYQCHQNWQLRVMFTFINISHQVIGINLNIHILKNKTNVCGAVKHIFAFYMAKLITYCY